MEESWETGFSQYPDMDYAQEFRGCRTMMNLEEEADEEFLRNIVEKPDPVRSEIISSSQRYETENNDHVMSPRALVLSFDNSKVEPIITTQDEHKTLKHRCLSKRIRARHNAEPMSKKKRRSLEEVEDHIMAERRRRQQITEKFIALSATIPGLKKLDKLTILDEAIKYMEQLQERVRELEKDPSLTSMKRIEFYENDKTLCEVNEVLPKIEVRVSENKQVFMGIYCEKQKGIEFKILSLLENFHLFVTSSSVLPFGKSTLGITIIAQVGDEYKTPLNEGVKLLRQIL